MGKRKAVFTKNFNDLSIVYSKQWDIRRKARESMISFFVLIDSIYAVFIHYFASDLTRVSRDLAHQ
jgi:hypothetical protein